MLPIAVDLMILATIKVIHRANFMIKSFRRLRVKFINFRIFLLRWRMSRLERREGRLVRRRTRLLGLLKE